MSGICYNGFFVWVIKVILFFKISDADFGTSVPITVKAGSSRACIDFSNLVVDDNIALEGVEAFTIVIGSSMAMVTIVDDDSMFVISL